MAKELTVEHTKVGGAPALKLAGELTFDTAPGFRDDLMQKVADRAQDIVVDLQDVSFMDTCGLATLIEARKKADGYGGRVVVIGVSPMIKEVMEITRVQELFALFDTTEEAEQALRGGR